MADPSSPLVVICVSSAASNAARRRSLRRSWLGFRNSSHLTPAQQAAVVVRFVLAARCPSPELQEEQAEHGDMLLLDAPEGYANLWRKALVSLAALEVAFPAYSYYMHADDDSYVRLDLLLPLLEGAPRRRWYWGYIWDGSGNRSTAPIRDPANKSHMPVEQYPLDHYPPFASGCGFVLSRDLAQALLAQPLPDYRLLDPPFGIHLCGRERCILRDGAVSPEHDERVRPYRALPIFAPTTIVQHYLRPEEMAPFHNQVLAALRAGEAAGPGAAAAAQAGAAGSSGVSEGAGSSKQAAAGESSEGGSAPEQLYAQLVALGLLRR